MNRFSFVPLLVLVFTQLLWSQIEPAYYNWEHTLEIRPRQGQHHAQQNMPTPAPSNATVHGQLNTWHDRPIELPDQDNEFCEGRVWATGGNYYLRVTENAIRGGDDGVESTLWYGVNLTNNPMITLDHGGFIGNDPATFFFTEAWFYVHAVKKGDPTPSGPGHE
jgi:hypothetical protein